MKTYKASQWFSLLLFITVAAGCARSTESMATSSPTVHALPVSSASLIETVTPTRLPATIVSSTSLFTPTVVPTLPTENARERLLELLATNGDCRLPCLWGITPAKSTNQEAQLILYPLGSISEPELIEFRKGLGTISPSYIEGDLSLNTWVAYLYGDDGFVSHIGFRVLEEKITKDSSGNWVSKMPIYGSSTFIKRVQYYSLSHLLSEQGIPSSVMIASSGSSINRSGSINFDIVVLYPNQGIWARYTTSINEDQVGSIIISCPINSHIEMNLYPPGNPDSFYTLLEKTDWSITKNSYKPLEEATSMSVEEFYQTFQNLTDKCIETPAKLWPTPEQ